MREDWELKKWEDVLEIRSGRNQKDVENPEGQYPIYGSGGTVMNYADDFICEEGTTIIGRKGTIDNPILIETKFWNVDTAFGLVANDELNKRFLYYFCLSFDFTSRDKGTTLPSLVKKDLIKIEMPIPPLPEQKRIVEILDEAFEAIDQARANVERNIQNAEELFQSKLNEIFSQRGDGWEEKTLEQIALEFGRGKSKHRPRNDEKLFGGDYPFIQTGDVRGATKYIAEFSQTYNETGLKQSKLWPQGTVCITIAANIAESAILDFDGCFPDSIIGIYVDPDKAHNSYAYYCLQYFKAELQAQGKGSAQDNINLGTFKERYFPFPDKITQKEVAITLDNLLDNKSALIDQYQLQLENLEELKKSILQKAFSGELTANEHVAV